MNTKNTNNISSYGRLYKLQSILSIYTYNFPSYLPDLHRAMSTASTMSFISSNKGKPMLLKEGFIYKINKQTSTKIYWICKTKNCGASIHTDLNCNFMQSNGTHNHLVEPEEIEIKRFREALKERVINETTPISKIYDEEMVKANLSPETLTNVPVIANISNIPPLKLNTLRYDFFP